MRTTIDRALTKASVTIDVCAAAAEFHEFLVLGENRKKDAFQTYH